MVVESQISVDTTDLEAVIKIGKIPTQIGIVFTEIGKNRDSLCVVRNI